MNVTFNLFDKMWYCWILILAMVDYGYCAAIKPEPVAATWYNAYGVCRSTGHILFPGRSYRKKGLLNVLKEGESAWLYGWRTVMDTDQDEHGRVATMKIDYSKPLKKPLPILCDDGGQFYLDDVASGDDRTCTRAGAKMADVQTAEDYRVLLNTNLKPDAPTWSGSMAPSGAAMHCLSAKKVGGDIEYLYEDCDKDLRFICLRDADLVSMFSPLFAVKMTNNDEVEQIVQEHQAKITASSSAAAATAITSTVTPASSSIGIFPSSTKMISSSELALNENFSSPSMDETSTMSQSTSSVPDVHSASAIADVDTEVMATPSAKETTTTIGMKPSPLLVSPSSVKTVDSTQFEPAVTSVPSVKDSSQQISDLQPSAVPTVAPTVALVSSPVSSSTEEFAVLPSALSSSLELSTGSVSVESQTSAPQMPDEKTTATYWMEDVKSSSSVKVSEQMISSFAEPSPSMYSHDTFDQATSTPASEGPSSIYILIESSSETTTSSLTSSLMLASTPSYESGSQTVLSSVLLPTPSEVASASIQDTYIVDIEPTESLYPSTDLTETSSYYPTEEPTTQTELITTYTDDAVTYDIDVIDMGTSTTETPLISIANATSEPYTDDIDVDVPMGTSSSSVYTPLETSSSSVYNAMEMSSSSVDIPMETSSSPVANPMGTSSSHVFIAMETSSSPVDSPMETSSSSPVDVSMEISSSHDAIPHSTVKVTSSEQLAPSRTIYFVPSATDYNFSVLPSYENALSSSQEYSVESQTSAPQMPDEKTTATYVKSSSEVASASIQDTYIVDIEPTESLYPIWSVSSTALTETSSYYPPEEPKTQTEPITTYTDDAVTYDIDVIDMGTSTTETPLISIANATSEPIDESSEDDDQDHVLDKEDRDDEEVTETNETNDAVESTATDKNNSGIETSLWVAFCILALAVILAIVVAVYLYNRRKKQKSKDLPATAENGAAAAPAGAPAGATAGATSGEAIVELRESPPRNGKPRESATFRDTAYDL
ncbi:uncharacterized protein LOC128234718 [Mya arenaria]|uniref:uncharacterized protein LOC128234718 n=1 Tax=Mya arenaria TaxID=6604 RepID=UPI0022E8FABA|nr:uncharacterized protein LOC128234718 [Mya arenaria]